MRLAEIKLIYSEQLRNILPPAEIESIFGILAKHFLGYSKIDLIVKKNKIIKDEYIVKFHQALIELERNKPVQYVTGETEFYGLRIKVDERVLIPRPETEELVDWIIRDINGMEPANEGLNILDIGTGSGCIAIALRKNIPHSSVTAIDISEKALQVAMENSGLNQADVRFLQTDILKQSAGRDNSGLMSKFSVMVSNPPYVTEEDKTKMSKNVLDYEPHGALFVPENKPLMFYDAIGRFALRSLEKNGLLYFEINENFGEQIRKLLSELGFADVEIRKDLSGKDRMVKASKNEN